MCTFSLLGHCHCGLWFCWQRWWRCRWRQGGLRSLGGSSLCARRWKISTAQRDTTKKLPKIHQGQEKSTENASKHKILKDTKYKILKDTKYSINIEKHRYSQIEKPQHDLLPSGTPAWSPAMVCTVVVLKAPDISKSQASFKAQSLLMPGHCWKHEPLQQMILVDYS